jgi:SAM-dependent methyltransferase
VTTNGFIQESFSLPEFSSEFNLLNYTRYVPSPVQSIRTVLDYLNITEIQSHKSLFIDIGSGTGRNLLIASEYPFKRIIGIEISKNLNEIAENNISIYKNTKQKCKNINTYCSNILDFKLPICECLIMYFYNPFSEIVFYSFLSKIIEELNLSEQKCFFIFLGVVYESINLLKNRKSSN